MNKLLNKAIRPLAALTIVGALAAVAAFAILAMPGGKPAAEAQATAVVTPTLTDTSVVLEVTGVTVIAAADDVGIVIPGYRVAPDTAADYYDEAGNKHCEVTATHNDPPVSTLNSGGEDFNCKNNSDEDGIAVRLGFAIPPGGDAFTVTLNDVQRIAATANASQLLYIQMEEHADAGTADDDYLGVTGATQIGYAADGDGIAYHQPGVDAATVSSTTSSASIQIQVTIGALSETTESGSAIALYLEDDYEVPASIDRRHVWFTVSGVNDPSVSRVDADGNPDPNQEPDAGRWYPTDDLDIDTDNYYGGGDDSHIVVYIPDMDTDDNADGYQGPAQGRTLTLTLHKNAGIKNPPEAGTHSMGYSLLPPDDSSVPDPPENALPNQFTYAKITLSDDDDSRGKVVTVTGSGFNNDVSASLYMRHYVTAGRYDATTGAPVAGDPNQALMGDTPHRAQMTGGDSPETDAAYNTYRAGRVMTQAETCADIIENGVRIGEGKIVGGDDKVQIEFTVANPPFQPGGGNLLCVADGEGRASDRDVEHFNLAPSISVTPTTVNAGQQVTVIAQDFPYDADDAAIGTFRWVKVVNETVATKRSSNISSNGKGSATFDMPGDYEGTIRVDACWGGDAACVGGNQENTKITVTPSQLELSRDEVRANESIIIRGSGFSKLSGDGNDLKTAKIGDAELVLASDSGNLASVEVSDSGQFSATFAIWSNDDNNPALAPGTHKIVIEDEDGFSGEANITIMKPTISITPNVAGPRDYVVISGTNWPVENDDGGDTVDVRIEVTGGGIGTDSSNEGADANGNWSYQYRVPGDVGIPSTLTVKAVYGEDDAEDISEITTFSVPRANLEVSPATVVPGGDLTISASGFSLYETNLTVKIGNSSVAVPTGTSTDREGNLEVTVKVPSLDAATYTVQLQVGGEGGTVAIGEVVVLDDDTGGESPLPGALSPLGDNLVRVFHFNNANKTWSFYDPRPEFADLNTLSGLTGGQSYWILVGESQDVTLNAEAHQLTCLNGECWNSIVW